MTKNYEVKRMYYVKFSVRGEYIKGAESLDETRKWVIAYMDFKNSVTHADVHPKEALIYRAKDKDALVGRVIYKRQRFWWVTYSTIQELDQNGVVKRLLTHIPL